MAVDRSLAERGAHGEFIAGHYQGFRRGIFLAGVVLTLTLLVATLCAHLAGSFWLFDLAVHFRVQYAALGLAGFILLLAIRSPEWALLALAVAAYNLMCAAPVLATHPVELPKVTGEPETGEPVRLRVLSLNVLYSNGDHSRVANFLRHARADVVVLSEMNAAWRRALSGLDKQYPHRYQTVGPGGHGISFWSRHPLEQAGVLPIGVAFEPAIEATLQVGGRELRVYAVHTSWPVTPGSTRERNLQLARLAARARAEALPLVVVGDLNTSPFSPHFEHAMMEARLRSAAEGFGWQPTWPTFMPFAGIQIDHALVNSRVAVEHFSRGTLVGSDHRPILVDLAF